MSKIKFVLNVMLEPKVDLYTALFGYRPKNCAVIVSALEKILNICGI